MPRMTGLMPMARPSGMPIRQASRKAPKTRAVEISTCCQNGVPVKPWVQMSRNFRTIACGAGMNSGLTSPAVVTAHHSSRMPAMVSRLSQVVLPCPGTP